MHAKTRTIRSNQQTYLISKSIQARDLALTQSDIDFSATYTIINNRLLSGYISHKIPFYPILLDGGLVIS